MILRSNTGRVVTNMLAYEQCLLQSGSKKRTPDLFLPYLQQMITDFNHFFIVTPRNELRINTDLCMPPHLLSVPILPSKTNAAAVINAKMAFWNTKDFFK